MRTTSHRPALFILTLLVISLLACSLGSLNNQTRGQYGFTPEEKRAQDDKKLEKSSRLRAPR